MTGPDGLLVKQARRGNMESFRELINRHRAKVHGIAYHICGNAEDARDIAQEAFIRVYRQFDRYDNSRPFSAWISRITVNLAIDHHRKRRTDRAVPFDDAGSHIPVDTGTLQPDQYTEQHEFKGEIERICGTLTAQQRSAFVLRDMEEYSTSETARMMGCRESTVRVHLAQARRRVRDELRKRYPEQFTGEGHKKVEKLT